MDNNTKLQADLQRYVYQLRIDASILVVELSDPTISKNAFERTLLMEERTRYMHEMREIKGRVNRISPLVLADMKDYGKTNNGDKDTGSETKTKGDEKSGDDDSEGIPEEKGTPEEKVLAAEDKGSTSEEK
ncbi:unnamed protein product [Gongylonema pulchrum]|uniref:Mediator complex subunit 9 n=1 Tax=Gongylonema pulchrum TaxID=637853 RepID=A0A183EPQ9_9BILA|nr:unnamed protein product [Gongylonema pulchrum]